MDDVAQRRAPGGGSACGPPAPSFASSLEAVELPSALTGKRVLIVENRFIVAEELIDLLSLLECEPVGPAGTLPDALDLIRANGWAINAAVLDINLEHEAVYPAAELLRAMGTPFAFATGYIDAAIPERWQHVPRLEKPYGVVSLRDTLDTLLGGWAAAPPAAGEAPSRSPPGPHPTDRRFERARKHRERQMEEAVLRKWQHLSGD